MNVLHHAEIDAPGTGLGSTAANERSDLEYLIELTVEELRERCSRPSDAKRSSDDPERLRVDGFNHYRIGSTESVKIRDVVTVTGIRKVPTPTTVSKIS